MMRTAFGSRSHVLAGVLLLSAALTACGGGGSEDTAGQTGNTGNGTAGTPMTPPLTAPPEDSTNRAPIVSGTAPTKVTVGEAYVFQPQASDPDNDVVTFTIANKPAWANFDPKTGKLWGTPTAENVGTYSAIEIAATDGSSVTALPPFDLTVTAVAGVPPKAVTVAWDAPTQNEDGSPLVDLQGYKIYYGRQSQKYETTITVDNPGLTRYVLENLAPGTYFVAVTAYNKSGVESAFSEELRATLN